MFRLASALATWFATLLTPDAKNRLPLTSDISHLETLCTVLHSLEFLFFPSLLSLSHSLFCSLSFICFPQLCSSSAIWLTAEADSGMEGIRWFQLEKLHSFCILLWTLLLSSCLFYSNTLKQKDKDGETFTQSVSAPTVVHFKNISVQWLGDIKKKDPHLLVVKKKKKSKVDINANDGSIMITCVVHDEGSSYHVLRCVGQGWGEYWVYPFGGPERFQGDPEWAMGVSPRSHMISAQPCWTPRPSSLLRAIISTSVHAAE